MSEILTDEQLKKTLEIKNIKNLMRDRKQKEARDRILKYVEENPDDYYGLFRAGRILIDFSCYDQAKELLLKVAESDCDNRFSAIATLGVIEEKLNNTEKAVEYYQKAIFESENIEIFAIESFCNILIRQSKYDEALKLISLIEKSYPDNYNLLLSRIYTAKKDYEKANECLDKIFESELNTTTFNRMVYLQKVIVNKCLSNYDKALYYVNKLKNKKDYFYKKSLPEEASIYYGMGNYKMAYDVCLKCDPNNSKVNFIMANANIDLGNISKAKDNYLVAINANNDVIRVKSFNSLGDIYCENRDYDKALEYYNLAVESNYVFSRNTYFKMIGVYLRKGEYDKAYQLLQRIKDGYAGLSNESLYKVLETFLCNKLGYPIVNDDLSYKEMMVLNHDDSKVISHIRNFQSKTRPKFFNLDLENLYFSIKEELDIDKRVEIKPLDTYDFHLENIGYLDEKIADKLRVITIPNSDCILDMFPTFELTLKDKINKENGKLQKIK